MFPILTASAMQRADKLTIEQFGIPSFALMESAGRAAAHRILEKYAPKRATILCGSGNNGGDGLVIARVLAAQGVSMDLILVGNFAKSTSETKKNLELVEALQLYGESNLKTHRFQNIAQLAQLATPDVWIDALLGTGLETAVRPEASEIIEWLNAQLAPKVAIDVPSGINATTGEVCGVAVRADHTITMAALKTGLLLNEAPDFTGSVEVVEIGIPRFILYESAKQDGAWQAEQSDIEAWKPKRDRRANKYTVGYVVGVLGSEGMSGAATMATLAAERIGAGGVICACPQSIQPILAQKLTTAMPFPLLETELGIAETALEALKPHLEKAKILLIGCGIGRKPHTQQFVRELLTSTKLPCVIDADALNALIGHTDLIREYANGNWILTPHWGEFKRLVNEDISEENRLEIVREKAKTWNCVILLKGFPSLIALPDGRVFINTTGNHAAATAGTGDILAGVCAGLLAQGMNPAHAAISAIYRCGKASERYTERYNATSMLATDLLEELRFV